MDNIKNERLEQFIEVIIEGLRASLFARSEDILKSWNSNMEEACENEAALPPLSLSMSAKVDLEKNNISTKLRFSSTFMEVTFNDIKDPNQSELPL